MMKQDTIGIVGTGLMGSAMARRYLQQGYGVFVYNRSVEKTEALVQAGAKAVDHPGDLPGRTGVMVCMLRDLPAAEQVLLGETVNWSGCRLIQMATLGIDETRDLARRIGERGGEYLEAPVLGSIPQVLAGELMVMAGGDRALFEDLTPVLQVLAARDLVYVGDLGQGAAMKLAFNQLIATLTTAFASSHALLKQEGVSTDLFMDLLRRSALYAPTFDKKRSMMEERSFQRANFTLVNMIKDLGLIETAFSARGISTAMLEGVRQVMDRAESRGFGAADYSALYEGVWR